MTETRRPDAAFVRQGRLRELLAHGTFRRTSELSDELGVSVVTIRADLEELEAQGAARRVRGGAVGTDGRAESVFETTRNEAAAGKSRIADHCVSLIQPGDIVMLDAGTTCAVIGRALGASNLTDVTVVTNNLIAMHAMSMAPGLELIVTGGTFRRQQHSLIDPFGTLVIDRFRADIAFIGATGVEREVGVTNVNAPEAEMKRAMIAASARHIVVADSRKLGHASKVVVCAPEEVSLLVTDADPASAEAIALQKASWSIDYC
ncbi:MAG: DeoR/GlpR family DNA-binding transcription regulator [Microbacterium sp.]